MSSPPEPPTAAEGDDEGRDDELGGRLDGVAFPADRNPGMRAYRNRRRRRLRSRLSVFAGAVSVALIAVAVISQAAKDRSEDQQGPVAGPRHPQVEPASSRPAVFATSSTLPWTTASTRPALSPPAVDQAACPQYQPGPMPPTAPGFSATEDDPRLQQSAISEAVALPALRVLQQYATDHPDGFFEVGLSWVGTTAEPFITYSTDIEGHCAEIAAILGADVRWVMRWNAYSDAEVRQLAAQLDDASPPGAGPVFNYEIRNGVVTVTLDPDQQWLADRLLELNSPKLAVILGAHPYPDLAASTSTCLPLDRSPEHSSRLTAQLTNPATVHSGARAELEVELHNPSDGPIGVDQPPPRGFLGDDNTILSTYVPDAPELAGRTPLVVGPGQSTVLHLKVSSATCNPNDGYQLPPGTYHLYIVLGADWTSTTITISP